MSHPGGVLVPPSSTVLPAWVTAMELYNSVASTYAVRGAIGLAAVAAAVTVLTKTELKVN